MTQIIPPHPLHGVRPGLSRATPNPFSKKTTLVFSLPVKQKASATVYDVAGRRVRTILDEELPAGDHGVNWDASDARGHRVAGGTYFVRLQAGGEVRTRKVVFLGN
jgi:flagellar hook assembly protein FlgD